MLSVWHHVKMWGAVVGLKKKDNLSRRDRQVQNRTHGSARTNQILTIIASDKLFEKRREFDEEFYEGPCIHCGTRLVVELDGKSLATIEHIVPLSCEGSSTDLLNLALACKRCNNEKGVRHDPNYGREPRSTDVINNLLERRSKRLK